ncbi:DUF397 domain-containing protein [Streptomyces sp. ISL-98]|uniref:DUF397 domain-containing protein n=1 Tax=Streptomyces sp. ISL-98 TaxID=2819192 RepID=UPI00203523BC|nr:DUF397 domain-containing protein [Streptomyces sp. ISL-98]
MRARSWPGAPGHRLLPASPGAGSYRKGQSALTDDIIRKWRKSSYSGQENTCVEILTPPPLKKPQFAIRRTPEAV